MNILKYAMFEVLAMSAMAMGGLESNYSNKISKKRVGSSKEKKAERKRQRQARKKGRK